MVAPRDSPVKPIVPAGDVEKDIAEVKRRLAGKRVLGVPNTCLDPGLYAIDATGARRSGWTPHASTRWRPRSCRGEGDLALLDVADADLAFERWPGRFKVVGPVSPVQEMAAAFRKDSPELREAFDAFLAGARKDGTYDRLLSRYFPRRRQLFPGLLRGGDGEPAPIDSAGRGARWTPGDRSAGPRPSSRPGWRSPPWWAGSSSRTTGPPRGAGTTSSASTRPRSSSGRRSSTMPSTVAERSLDAAGESPEVGALLEAQDLGLSEQYGLALSRAATRDRLRTVTRHGQFGAEPAFIPGRAPRRAGKEVAGGGRRGTPRGIDLAPHRRGTGEASCSCRTGPGWSRCTTWSGAERDRRASWWASSRPDHVTRALVQGFRRGPSPRIPTSWTPPARPFAAAGLRTRRPCPKDVHAIPADGMGVVVADESRPGGARSWPASRSREEPLPRGRPPVDAFFRAVPSEAAAAYLAAAVALVLGAVGLAVFLNVRALVRRTRQEESSARERELGEKDDALEREAAERQRVERSRAVLANALEQSADAVAITDTALRIVHVKPAFEQLTGRPGGEPGDGCSSTRSPRRRPGAGGAVAVTALRRGAPGAGCSPAHGRTAARSTRGCRSPRSGTPPAR